MRYLRTVRILPYLVLVVLAAGCVSVPAAVEPATTGAAPAFEAFVPPAPEFDFATIIDPDHASHQLPHLHGNGYGLALVGHTGIDSLLPPDVSGSITAIDISGSYALVAGYQGDLAFAIVDISDPAAPIPVSAFLGGGNPRTARFSDDGNYVFFGCESPGGLAGAVGLDCEGERTPGGGDAGVVVVDVHDKEAPTFVDFLATGGAHNIFVTSVNGIDHVFTSAVTILAFDREAGSLKQVAEVPGTHDATVARHPGTGDMLLFTGTSELAIYNVNDPANPEPVYEAENADWIGWHDQVLIPQLVDGRAILLLGGESFVGTAQGGVVYVMDVTDPAAPALLGEWIPPFLPKVPWASYLFSMHEMAATPTGQVAVSWNHGGVWVIDVSTKERQSEPVTLAAFQPHEMPDVVPSFGPSSPLWMLPRVWGAGWDARGFLVVPDMLTGVYVLEPEWGLRPTLESGQ